MRSKADRFSTCVTIVLLVSLSVFFYLFFLRHFLAPASYGYNIYADFEEAPENDTELEAWLLTHDRTLVRYVGRRKVNGLVRIEIGVTLGRVLWDCSPPFPGLAEKCEELGYIGQQAAFQDIPAEN